MIISVSGKGGVGKSTLLALLLDEWARCGREGPILVVDADPAGALPLALGWPSPPATVADVRDSTRLAAKTIRQLPLGQSPADLMLDTLREQGVLARHWLRETLVDLMAMGQAEGPGCYCSVNHALSAALAQIVDSYPLVLIDNEGGLEHLSRYRLARADLLLVVANPTRPARMVADRILQTARQVGLEFEAGLVLNRADGSGVDPEPHLWTVILPESQALAELERAGLPPVQLPADDPLRRALAPLLDRMIGGTGRCV